MDPSHRVSIELDVPAGSYRAGDSITGRVIVEAGADEHLGSFGVELHAVARGRISSVGIADRVRFTPEPWARGGTYTYPFSITAPPLAPPYAGHLFRIEHRIAAVIEHGDEERSRAVPAAERAIAITPTERIVLRARHQASTKGYVSAFRFGEDGQRTVTVGSATVVSLGSRKHVVILAGVLVVGLVLMLAGVMIPVLFRSMPSFVGCFVLFTTGALTASIGGMLLRRASTQYLAERKLGGMPVVSFEAQDTPQGPNVTLTIDVAPGAKIEQATVSFRAIEQVSGDTELETHRAMESAEHVAAVKTGAFACASPGRWAVTVPPDVFESLPFPFGTAHNQIVWEMDIEVLLDGGRRWTMENTLLEAERGKGGSFFHTFRI